MLSFARLAVAFAALGLVSSSALAVVEVEGNTANFVWTPSSGPVSQYAVHVVRDDGRIMHAASSFVSEPRATVHGEYGEMITVYIVA
jgi:hypothetical protein